MASQAALCAHCGFLAESVFCRLSSEALSALEREKNVRVYDRGRAVYREGDPPFAVYCIRSGQVKLSRIGGRAEQQVIRLAGPGETIGYGAVLENRPYAETAEVVSPTVACAVSRQTLVRLLRESPDLAFALMAKLARELRFAEQQILSMSQESVRQRTANVLLMLSEGSGGAPRIQTPIRRKEMAQMIGTTPETLSRVLKSFSERGVVSRTRIEIRIQDPVALRKLARVQF
jgi:CRP-like cAMP-binding protein